MFHPAAGRFSSALPWNNYESELVPCQARIAKSRWEFLWHFPSFSAFPDRCRVSAAISRRFPVFAPLSAVQETAWRKGSQPVLFHQKYFTRNARVRASVQMDTNHRFAPVLLGSAQSRPQKFVKNAQKNTAQKSTAAGQALGVLVGQDAAHGRHDGRRDDTTSPSLRCFFPKKRGPALGRTVFFHDHKMPAFLPPQFRQKRLLFEPALLIIFL